MSIPHGRFSLAHLPLARRAAFGVQPRLGFEETTAIPMGTAILSGVIMFTSSAEVVARRRRFRGRQDLSTPRRVQQIPSKRSGGIRSQLGDTW